MKIGARIGYSTKNPNMGREVWRHRISRAIEERAYENSRFQTKEKWNFRWVFNENSCGIFMGHAFDLGISKGCHNFPEFPESFSVEFLRAN